jgi:hypothetical protein
MPIANIKKGSDAYDCLHYVLEKEQAILLETNCIGDDPRVISNEFKVVLQNHLRNGAKKHTTLNVHHCSIGMPVGMELNELTLLAIAHTYLESMGFNRGNNQYLVAQHHDSKHPHIHIIANRIGVDGKTVSDSWERRKAEAIMRQIEADYNLPINQSSREVEVKAPKVGEVRRARDRGEPIPRVWMQEKIQEIAPQCLTLPQLKEKLAAVGIDLEVVPLKSKKGKKQGRGEEATEEATEELVETLPPEQWDTQSVGLIYRLNTPSWKQTEQSQGGINEPQNGKAGKGKQRTRGKKRSDRVVKEEASGPFAVFSASRLGKRFTQQGLKHQFGVGLPLAQQIEREVEKSIRRLFDAEKWLASEFGAELMEALPGAEVPVGGPTTDPLATQIPATAPEVEPIKRPVGK